MSQLFNNAFQDLPVLITGHTGFKGSWLTTWLVNLGAKVTGFSLADPPTTPSNFTVANLHEHIIDIRGDVRDLSAIRHTIETYRPVIVFHLAAQPIVLHSYEQPHLTFHTNAGGTINLLESVRTTSSVRAVISITTDKVYEDREWVWGYRENDALGGSDPYSASKAMAEIVIKSYRDSFFPPQRYAQHQVALASTRAGNVIGGGDFADYRLVPDCMRALMAGETIQIRNPQSIRPWQLVLEPLSGYLWLAANLMKHGPQFATAWNFGPQEHTGVTTRSLAEMLISLWGSGEWEHIETDKIKKETGMLRLSWEKAATELQWQPVYTWQEALAEIVAWFKELEQGSDMYQVGQEHISAYVDKARQLKLPWVK